MNEVEMRRLSSDLMHSYNAEQAELSPTDFIQGTLYAAAVDGVIEHHEAVPAMAAEVAFNAGRRYEGDPLEGIASRNLVAAANFFIASDTDLQTRRRLWGVKPGEYEFEFGDAWEVTNGGGQRKTTVAEFIGGIASALLDKGHDDVDGETIVQDAVEVSFVVGRLIQAEIDDTSAFSELTGEITDQDIEEACGRIETLLKDISLAGGVVKDWHPKHGVVGAWIQGEYRDYED